MLTFGGYPYTYGEHAEKIPFSNAYAGLSLCVWGTSSEAIAGCSYRGVIPMCMESVGQ